MNTRNYSVIGSRVAADGFSLIEVLVALVVLSVGLLGLAALQSNAVGFNHNAYLRSQATVLAYDIADRMRANRDVARTGAYNAGFAGTLPACGNSAVVGTVVQQDIAAWRRALVCTLPLGNGSINYDDGTEVLKISVQWDESRGLSAPEAFVMTTGL